VLCRAVRVFALVVACETGFSRFVVFWISGWDFLSRCGDVAIGSFCDIGCADFQECFGAWVLKGSFFWDLFRGCVLRIYQP
jgi:hypothetical protein